MHKGKVISQYLLMIGFVWMFYSIQSRAASFPESSLPVKITIFTAKYNPGSNGVNLHWVTINEKDSVQYIIERSLDSVHFQMIGETHSVGSSNKKQHYYYSDSHPMGGDSYYRIREIDADRKQYLTPVAKVYKPIVSLNLAQVLLSSDGNELDFAIISPDSTKAGVLISDVEGHVRASFAMPLKRGANLRSIYSGNLLPGVYFLQINDLDGGGSVMKKFIKKAIVEKPKKDSVKASKKVPASKKK